MPPWLLKSAYPYPAPRWWLLVDRNDDVVERLRGERLRQVVDVPRWGCLVGIYRGIRRGVLAVTDDGRTWPVTPEDDEGSWTAGPSTGAGDGSRSFVLTRTDLDGSQTTVGWSPDEQGLAQVGVSPTSSTGADARIGRVSWNTAGGTLEGLLSPPDGPGPFPLVVYLHGGPWFGLNTGMVGDSDFWTSRGAALLQAEYAGSGVLGEQMMWEPLRGVGMPQRDLDADGVTDAVQYLVDAGVADPDRVYVYGFSAGGYLVNRIVTHTHPFTAACVWDSTADPRAFTGQDRDIQIFWRGCTPEQDPALWAGASPITRADMVTIPLTIISGGRSNLPEHCLAWHTALTRAGADSTLYTFPDQDHVFTSAAHQKVLHQLADTWQLTSSA